MLVHHSEGSGNTNALFRVEGRKQELKFGRKELSDAPEKWKSQNLSLFYSIDSIFKDYMLRKLN